MELILEDEDAMDKGVADKLKKKKPDDADRDEGPLDGSNQGPQNLGDDMGNTDEPPVVNLDPKDWFKKPERPPTQDPEWNEGTCRSYIELEYNMEECYKALTNQLDWNNPEGDRYPFNLSKPLPLVKSGNRQIILVDYFFNHDLAYLQGGSTGRTYSTSLTKTKAAKVSKHDMYSTKRILAVTNVKVNVWYGYGHLEEIKVRRFDQKLYKFMEGDFPQLFLNDIEDILLLVKRVEDLQLGVESYQKKLNISKLRTREEDLSRRAPYTSLLDPQGVIYEDKLNRKRLMRCDELYKFSDDTLQLVRDTLHEMATNLRMGYNKSMPKRRWSHLDKTRSHIMVKEIDHHLQERRLMRSLEKFVGGRYYREDLRLLQRTIWLCHILSYSLSPWVSPVHCVPKKGGITVVKNEENELIPTRLVTGWRVCIDYRKLNDATRKDHFPLPFMDQMLERLAGNEYYCFLDGFSGYFQIPIDPLDQEKTTFTCPYGTFAYRRMPFGLCNAPAHSRVLWLQSFTYN
ncbi:uncharacterized mitochondrial protein-like protein [Tanacetum coccineum]